LQAAAHTRRSGTYPAFEVGVRCDQDEAAHRTTLPRVITPELPWVASPGSLLK
jgi:hypothetical protein